MKILDYIFAARPLLHLPVWSVYLVTLFYHLQLSKDQFALQDILMLLALTLATSASYYINQIYDYESDLINDKLGFLQKEYISFGEMKTLYYICAILSIAIAFYLSIFAGVLIVILLLLGAIYSAPPFRLKDRPILGLLANAIGYGFIVPFTVMPDMTFHNNGLLGWDTPFYFSLTIGAIYLLTTIPDKEGDNLSGKKTLAVILSIPMIKLLALLLLLDSAAVAYNSGFTILLILSIISTLVLCLSLFSESEKILFLSIKLPILLLTVVAGYFFCFYIIFIVALIIITRLYYKKRFNMEYPKLT